MKKLHLAALLALTGVGVFAPGAQAAVTTYTAGDLFLGFRSDTNTSTEILIDLGQASNYRDGLTTGGLNSIIGTGLGSILVSNFGSTWFTDNTVHWGITGTPGGSAKGLDAGNTLYISNPETNAANPPVPDINANQATAVSAILTMKGSTVGSGWFGQTVTSGLLNGVAESSSTGWSWSSQVASAFGDNPQYGAFEDVVSGASAQDLIRLTRTGATSNGLDGKRGFFTIDSTGQVSYTSTAVPEPTAITMLGGAGMLFLARRRRKPVTA